MNTTMRKVMRWLAVGLPVCLIAVSAEGGPPRDKEHRTPAPDSSDPVVVPEVSQPEPRRKPTPRRTPPRPRIDKERPDDSPPQGTSCVLGEPPAVLCSTARVIPGTAGQHVVYVDAAGAGGATTSCGVSVTDTVWFEVTPEVSGPLTFSTCGPGTTYDTVVEAWSGSDPSCAVLTPEGCSDDTPGLECTGDCGGARSKLTINATAGQRYVFQVGAGAANPPECALCLTATVTIGSPCGDAPTNVDCALARELPGTPGTHEALVDATDAVVLPGEPTADCAEGAIGHSVWFKVTPTISGPLRFSACHPNTSYDTVVQALRGDCAGFLSVLDCVDDTPTAACGNACSEFFASEVTITVTAGQTYYFQVGSFAGNAEGCDLCLGVSVTLGTCLDNADCDDGNECTDDVCDGGLCANTPVPSGTACLPDGNECTDNVCDDAGTCSHPAVVDGTACGSPSASECDAPDSCSAGVCRPNRFPTGTSCGDSTNTDCTNRDTCDGFGNCSPNNLAAGIPCTQDGLDCTDDVCDGAGACIHPLSPPGESCTDDDNDCTDDVCDAIGICRHPLRPDGTDCGDHRNTACDNPDTCAGGVCQPNFEPAGISCDDGTFCNGVDTCNGFGLCRTGLPPCAPGEFCDESADECTLDCNNNGLEDVCDLDCGPAGGPCDLPGCGLSEDCNRNGVPDECEPDCDGDGIPDECEIAACPGVAACDDCNQNGVPDECDIADGTSLDQNPPDGIPDECVSPEPGQHDWSSDVWGLAGGFPDNEVGVGGLHVTVTDSELFLDQNVTIEGLRLRLGAELKVTKTTDGDLTIDPTSPGGILNEGTILVASDRRINASGGLLKIGEGGKYVADPAATGVVSAGFTARTLSLTPTFCGASDQMSLTDAMTGATAGDVVLDGADVNLCGCLPEFCSFRGPDSILGGRTPAILKVRSVALVARGSSGFGLPPASLNIGGSLRLIAAAELQVRPPSASAGDRPVVALQDDFDNRSVIPSLFDWIEGELVLASSGLPHVFEVAGMDLGPTAEGFDTDRDALFDPRRHSNFSIGVIHVPSNNRIEFVNRFANTVGTGACDEALYVRELRVRPGVRLTLDNCRIFYETLVNDGAVIETLGCGALVQLPTGDYTGDGVVNADDWPDFLACLTGPNNGPIAPGCRIADFDADDDIDALDVAEFALRLSAR